MNEITNEQIVAAVKRDLALFPDVSTTETVACVIGILLRNAGVDEDTIEALTVLNGKVYAAVTLAKAA